MDRISEHPILGNSPEGKMVTFTFDGKELSGYEGEPIAVALRVNGVMVHRYTAKRCFLCNRQMYGLRHDCGWCTQCPHMYHAIKGGNEG